MNVNWQQAFYVTTSVAMVIIAFMGIFYLWLIYNVFQFLKKLSRAIDQGHRIIEDVDYFQRGVRAKILRFLLKIFEKGDRYE